MQICNINDNNFLLTFHFIFFVEFMPVGGKKVKLVNFIYGSRSTF